MRNRMTALKSTAARFWGRRVTVHCTWYCTRAWEGELEMPSYTSLTWAQRYEIVLYCNSRGIRADRDGIRNIQDWAVKALNVQKPPSRSTIQRILRNEELVENWAVSYACQRKQLWSTRNNVLDEQLRRWVIRMWQCGVFLSDVVIQEKARRLQCSLNQSALRAEYHTSCTFSNGWLYAFKQRHNLKCHKSHGELGDADHEGAAIALPELRLLAQQFHLRDIFNADEFGLYYSASPTQTIGPGPIPGNNKSKKRVTFLVCSNVDGTEYIPPLMIGKAKRPRCFHGFTGAELGIDYDNGTKAWMTTAIFTRWLLRLDARIGETPGRRILLFIDNASSHGKEITLPRLPHVEVKFLPKNTTPILQPMDLGVIAAIKRRYKQKVVEHAVDLIDSGHCEGIYDVDMRTAATWVYEIWDRVENEIVYNCWKKSRIV